MSSMVSIVLAFMLMIGGNPGYINSPPEVPESAIENPTEYALFLNCPFSSQNEHRGPILSNVQLPSSRPGPEPEVL